MHRPALDPAAFFAVVFAVMGNGGTDEQAGHPEPTLSVSRAAGSEAGTRLTARCAADGPRSRYGWVGPAVLPPTGGHRA
ncbi:hypothetical protein ACFV4Q_20845 [Streptomyces nojiriensis]|uniref:hypothetical protein n=1 Tax=Streptomyces nojiriensis TaxID=66374 RepID=UPI00366A4396